MIDATLHEEAISLTRDLDKGTYKAEGHLTARVFGGSGTETFDAKSTITVDCKPCPNEQITDQCACPSTRSSFSGGAARSAWGGTG